MATAASSIIPNTSATSDASDIGAIWRAAMVRYEEITKVKIESLTRVDNADRIMEEIQGKETGFKGYRHDSSKLDKFRSAVSKSLGAIDKLSSILGPALSHAFPPSTAIFTTVSLLIKAATSVSADYDKIAGLFEEFQVYLLRLKILEGSVPPVPELKVALTEVLVSVLTLCAISAKYIKKKRIVKAFKNLVSGEDDELSKAYEHFHKMIAQEEGAVRNATLAAVIQLQKGSTSVHTAMREGFAVTDRIDLNTKALLVGTEHVQTYLASRETTREWDGILARLSSLSFDEKQKDVFAKYQPGTGQWLLQTDEFQRWFKGEHPSILWCPGIPGAGKTVITSLAVNYVQEALQGTNIAIAYVYCDYENPKTHSELKLLSSIARQLTEQTSSIPLVVKEFCEKGAERRRNPTGDELISLVESICLLFQTTYVFIDALDECPEINRENFLRLIQKLEPFVRLFITSRPNVDLAKLANKSRIDIVASDSDIKIYLKSQVSTNNRLSLFTAKDMKLGEDIVKNLSDKAAGMFLLPYIHVEQLSKQRNLKSVRKLMKELPAKVFATYDEAMKRIEDQEEEDSQSARKALSYIFCARRPLKIEELRHVLAVEVGDTEVDPTAFEETEILLNISAGLVRIDESGTVGLVHYTLQEYLERNREKLLPDPDVEIARACLTYLSFDDFRGGPCTSGRGLQERLQEYQFLDYASHNWGYHVQENQLHESIVDLLSVFLKDTQRVSSFVQALYVVALPRTKDWHDCFPKQFGPLHVTAFWGLYDVLIGFSWEDIDINSQDSFGATALQLAARNGHQSVTQLLLSKGANVNTINENGETALYWAVRNGYSIIVKLLLMDRANVLTKDNEGWTALDWAVIGGNNDVVKMILGHGADISDENDGKHKALYLAAEEGHELTVQMLLDSGVDVNTQDSLGSSALDFAAAPGHEETVHALLQNGADVESRDIDGNTVLHWAALYEAIVLLLLKNGAKVDAKNNKGQTALSWAAQDGPVAAAQVLIANGAEVNAQDSYGFTALHRATLRDREAMVRLLLEKGADPNVKDKDQWTPLHVAALKQHEGLVQVLLGQVDDGTAILDWVGLQLQDTKKRALLEDAIGRKAEASTVLTGLREATQKRQLGRSRLLLEKGADVNAKDIGGWTALTIATAHGYMDSVQLLLENGADINIKGHDERTALHWASEGGHEEVVQLLVESGADIDASAYGWTAMLLAIKNEYMAIVYYLIESGADVNAEDCYGRTALHWAAKYGDDTIVQLLVSKGADFNAADHWGRTSLLWAVEDIQQVVVEMLLEIGANIEAKARHNITVLHMAVFMGFESAVQLLLEKGADVTAEAQWCGAEDGGEYENSVLEVTGESLSDLLYQWSLEQGSDVREGRGVTALQLADRGGHVVIQRLLAQKEMAE